MTFGYYFSFTAPPTEETLLQNTLWPEVQKLYGHGYEVFNMAADPQHKMLVSSTKAQQAEHASIFIWDVENWQLVDKLVGHSLTVTQMAFSPDGQRLLSVSRDRTWLVHEKVNLSNGKQTLKTVAKGSGGSRILWSCDWSHDSRYFVTGSRDKRVVVWSPDGDSYAICGQPLLCNDSVTAVAFCPLALATGSFVLAIGLDSGVILIYKWTVDPENQWNMIATLNQRYFLRISSNNLMSMSAHALTRLLSNIISRAHHKTVNRLKFRPVPGATGVRTKSQEMTVELASCGADNALKIYTICLDRLLK